MVRWSRLRRAAIRLTCAASAREPGRNAWSIVTAMSFGPDFRRARQPDASLIRAIESGPPETARITRSQCAISAKSAAASADEIGAASTPGALLFALDALSERERGARIFASDLIEGRARRVLFAEGGERLAEPEERVRRPAGGFVFRRYGKEAFRSITVPLALK